jgi:tetratricopeptide (TPR) repeat protein
MGYVASTGEVSSVPPNIDAIVTYQDRWRWDMIMYMLRLNIQLRNPDDKAVWAAGHVYKPSLQRATPQAMVEEVLKSIFETTISSEERLLLNAFYDGKASLVIPGWISGLSEAAAYGSTIGERREYYDQGAWEALALNTLKTNYGDNSAWFYLGRAAEELGYISAAVKYYEKSIQLSKSFKTRCLGPVCSGFTFPDDSQIRLEKIEEMINKEGKKE